MQMETLYPLLMYLSWRVRAPNELRRYSFTDIMLVDNPINQTILSTFMRKKKIKYDVAKNGAEAVAKWKTGSFHLILVRLTTSAYLWKSK